MEEEHIETTRTLPNIAHLSRFAMATGTVLWAYMLAGGIPAKEWTSSLIPLKITHPEFLVAMFLVVAVHAIEQEAPQRGFVLFHLVAEGHERAVEGARAAKRDQSAVEKLMERARAEALRRGPDVRWRIDPATFSTWPPSSSDAPSRRTCWAACARVRTAGANRLS